MTELEETQKKKRGGARIGAGRKKKCVKRLYFSASQEVLDALATIDGNRSDYICKCILKCTKADRTLNGMTTM